MIVGCKYLRPHAVIVTIRDNKDYIRVLFYSCYTAITGWGVLLTHMLGDSQPALDIEHVFLRVPVLGPPNLV